MPRTFFNGVNRETFTKSKVLDFSQRCYTWLPQLQGFPISEWWILVNPENGSWAAFDKDEFSLVKNQKIPQDSTGEFLYQLGLCSCNGRTRDFVRQSEYTENLYFFEFAVTTGCNLACKYCFSDSQPSSLKEKASAELAELFVDRVAEHRTENRTHIPFIIEFTGGEPLTNFEVIRHTVEYAERMYGSLLNAEFIIQSNLTLLDDDILEFCKLHEIGIGASCDGFETIHDEQRPFANGKGSHRIVVANMKKLSRLYPENSGAVITVITQKNVNKMAEIVLYLYLCGYREINLKPMAELGRGAGGNWKKPFAKSYVDGLFKVLNSVITPIYYETGELIKEHFLSRTFQHLFHPYRAFMCEKSPCGAARNICIVMPNGDVYPCNQYPRDKQLLLGNIKFSSFSELMKTNPAQALRDRTSNRIEECRKCIFKSWCGSPCPSEALKKYGSIMEKSVDCEIYRLRYITALRGFLDNELDMSVVSKLAELDEETMLLKTIKGGD